MSILGNYGVFLFWHVMLSLKDGNLRDTWILYWRPSTQDFWANSTVFHVCLPADNLLVWLLWLTMRQTLREEPDTVRGWLIRVPAKLVTHAGKLVLKVAAGAFQNMFPRILHRKILE
ncbi:MAG: hypothetical protein GY794_11545 [bacterium]|nr:hypothetical protein [bacterium]